MKELRMECKQISDHDFEFFKKNKKDFNELPVYKCVKCGMTWEKMEQIREAQVQLDERDLSPSELSAREDRVRQDIEEGFKRLFGWGND